MSFQDYDVSAFGFLPQEYIEKLPQTWSHLQPVIDNLSVEDGQKFREYVKTLPPLSSGKYSIEGLNLTEKKFLYSMIILITQKYVWGCGSSNLMHEIPEELGHTIYMVAEDIGIPPKLTYASVILYNWALKDVTQPLTLDNLKVNYKMTDTKSYEWFSLIHVAIEARGGVCVKQMMEAKEHMKNKNHAALIKTLGDVTEAIRAMNSIILRMYENCSPEDFWNFRFFFEGTVNPQYFPDGLKVKGGKHKPLMFTGISAAQSALIQSIDAFFAVKHEGHGEEVFQTMRDYMPLRHRKYVEDLTAGDNIRNYVSNTDDEELLKAYNRAVDRFTVYRQTHLKVVHDYVFEPINRQKKAAEAAMKENEKKGLYTEKKNGTGGSDAKPFLEETINETRATKTVSHRILYGEGKNSHQKTVITVQGFRPRVEDVLVAFITAMIGVYVTRIILSVATA